MGFIDLAVVKAIKEIIYGTPFLTDFEFKLLHVLLPEIIQ